MKYKKETRSLCENNNYYFSKFQSEFGLDTTASLTQEDEEEAEAIRQFLANNPLPRKDEWMEMPMERT